MNVNLAEKLRELRRSKNVSQEKLADYLGVSYQAVSKWENGVTSPDITLLGDISRYFGITVDELLGVEKIDEGRYVSECAVRSADLTRCCKSSETISIWLEAHRKLPNNIRVKEMLMSSYFDTDKVKYQNEIIELATEIWNSDCDSYYKGRAVNEAAWTYAEVGNQKKAEEWAGRAFRVSNSQEVLLVKILENERRVFDIFAFANDCYLTELFWMTVRLNDCEEQIYGDDYVQRLNKTVCAIFELVYPDGDAGYETLGYICTLHLCIAADEIKLKGDKADETEVKINLTRAAECAVKSASVKAHKLPHPLVCGLQIPATPTDGTRLIQTLKTELNRDCFDAYRNRDWFVELVNSLDR